MPEIIDITSFNILRGALPPRAYGLVVEWAIAHRRELLVNWSRARDHKALNKIAPLE